ncbi:MAG: hypothetical protein K940chlam8_00432 [Chlamydiae bacterium]|nr:hypothetical protein [Chlamydiota bacterium]
MTSSISVLENYHKISNPTHVVQFGLKDGYICGQVFWLEPPKTHSLKESNLIINDNQASQCSNKQELLDAISRAATITFTCLETTPNTSTIYLHYE